MALVGRSRQNKVRLQTYATCRLPSRTPGSSTNGPKLWASDPSRIGLRDDQMTTSGGPRNYISIRILHVGSKAKDKGRFQKPYGLWATTFRSSSWSRAVLSRGTYPGKRMQGGRILCFHPFNLKVLEMT